MTPPRTTPRERARTETTRAIVEEARRQLAGTGAAGLSLRSVAREVGMVSSAVYRYFPSRDELLTTLIIEAYDAVGERAEAARAAGGNPREQWRAVWRAVRDWAREHPAEYALIYGTPVPGYVAPTTTLPAAGRVGIALAGIVADGAAPDPGERARAAVVADLLPGLDPTAAPALVAAWTQLFGTVGFELFGQYEGVVLDREAYLDHVADAAAAAVGLPG